MLYDVYIQGRKFKSIEAEHTHSALSQAIADLENDRVPDRDHGKPPQLVVRPAHLSPLTPADCEDLFRGKANPPTPPAPPEPAVPEVPANANPGGNGGAKPRAQMRKKK
jgi:hypothetical protein